MWQARRRATAGLGAALVLLTACTSTNAATPVTRTSVPVTSTSAIPSTATTPAGTMAEIRIQVPSELAAAPFDQPRTLKIPAGWSVSLWARVSGARLAAWAPDGKLLISRPGSGDVLALTPRDGQTPTQTTLVSGLDQPHGLAFTGNTLYVAETNEVLSFQYSGGAVTHRSAVVGHLPSPDSVGGSYAHPLKSVAVGSDGALYVSVGSTGNLAPDDLTANPERAVILRVPVGGGTPAVFASGVRNGTGLAIAPDGSVWTAVNNRDNLAYPYHRDYDSSGSDDYGQVLQSYVNDHPMEPVAKLTAGRNLGWPFCNPDPDVRPGEPDTPLVYNNRPSIRDAQTNADGSKLDCSTLAPVEQGLPAHSAPLGFSFASLPGFGEGALIASHGSWNRTPPQAPEVSFFPWINGTLGNRTVLISGFQESDGSRWGRPVMAVLGPDHAIYVTDDGAGAVYRIVPN